MIGHRSRLALAVIGALTFATPAWADESDVATFATSIDADSVEAFIASVGDRSSEAGGVVEEAH